MHNTTTTTSIQSTSFVRPIPVTQQHAPATLADRMRAVTPALDALCADALTLGDMDAFKAATKARDVITEALFEGRAEVPSASVPAEFDHALRLAGLSRSGADAPPDDQTARPAQAAFKPQKPARAARPSVEIKQSPEMDALLRTGGVHTLRSGPQAPARKVTLPAPPSLSESGEKISRTMLVNLQGLSRMQDPAQAATKLAACSHALQVSIQDHKPATERPDLLGLLRSCLYDLASPLQATTEWAQAVDRLEVADKAASPAAASFRKMTTTGLQVIARHLDSKAGSDYRPGMFADKITKTFGALMARVKTHEPAQERYAMLVHLARTVNGIAQSADAIRHPVEKLLLATLLATQLEPAAAAVDASDPRNRHLQASLGRLLRLCQAEVFAHSEEGLLNRIEAAFTQRPANLVDECLAIARAIGTAPVTAAEKKMLVYQLNRQILMMATDEHATEAQAALAAADSTEIFIGLRVETQDTARWPDPSVYACMRPQFITLDLAEAGHL